MLGYTSWHQFFVLQLYKSFFICSLFLILIIQLSIIYSLLFIQISSIYNLSHVILYTLFICTSTSSFLTHSLGHFLTTIDLHGQVLDAFFYYSGVRWDHRCCEELEFSPIWLWYSGLLFIPVSILSLIPLCQIQFSFHFFIYMISCVDAYIWYYSDR